MSDAPANPAPYFSVVIPTYNRADLVGATLDSILSQTETDFEVLVVDDGSRDGTPEVVRRYAPRVRLIEQVNAGPGTARNRGAAEARGTYLAFLDSDDLWFPWTLRLYRQMAEAHQQPAFMVGKPFLFEDPARVAAVAEDSPELRMLPDYLSHPHEQLWWGVSSFVVRRDIFKLTGGFLEGRVNAEDADLTLRLGVAPGFLVIQRPFTFAYRQHTGSVMRDNRKNYEGLALLVHREQDGAYPGGRARQRDRWTAITRHTRSGSVSCLNAGLRREAWDLYRRTWRWNFALRRWKYLVAFPLAAAFTRRSAA